MVEQRSASLILEASTLRALRDLISGDGSPADTDNSVRDRDPAPGDLLVPVPLCVAREYRERVDAGMVIVSSGAAASIARSAFSVGRTRSTATCTPMATKPSTTTSQEGGH